MRGSDQKKRQVDLVRSHLMRNGWSMLGDIARAYGIPEASVSARLRDLAKPQYGSYTVEKRRINGTGLYQYRLPIGPTPTVDLAHGKTPSMRAGSSA